MTTHNNAIPGRAHTPEQKRAIVERLYTKWLEAPSLRLGQLVYVGAGEQVFFIEDETLIANLEERIITIVEVEP